MKRPFARRESMRDCRTVALTTTAVPSQQASQA
jgi:hypothetical protein